MEMYVAVIRTERNGNVKHIVSKDYATKKAYKQDLKTNGFIILSIFNSNQVEDIKRMRGYELDSVAKEYVNQLEISFQ